VGAALRGKLDGAARDKLFIIAVLPGAPQDAGAAARAARAPRHATR
jgi:hypothetical protein